MGEELKPSRSDSAKVEAAWADLYDNSGKPAREA